MEINRKRVARRLASGLVAGALAFGGLALSGASPAGAVPIELSSDQRLGGADRYATAALVAEQMDIDLADSGDGVTRLIVANGTDFADALAASPLVGDEGAILLVTADSIPSSSRDRMFRLADTVEDVFVVGGTTAISESVFGDIEEIFEDSDVTRIAGANRYETAAAVAAEVGYDGGLIALVSGASWADAVTIGAWAVREGAPVLLTTSGSLPEATEAALEDALDDDAARVVIVGGTAVVGAGTEQELVELGFTTAGISRIAGADRYQTNLLFNIEEFSAPLNKYLDAGEIGSLGGASVTLVSGANFPDALAAAPLAALNSSHLVLVDPTSVGSAALTLAAVGGSSQTSDADGATAVTAALTDSMGAAGAYFAGDLWVVGGTSAVPNSVVDAMDTAANGNVNCAIIVDPANDSNSAGPGSAIIAFSAPLQQVAAPAGEGNTAFENTVTANATVGTEFALVNSTEDMDALIEVEGDDSRLTTDDAAAGGDATVLADFNNDGWYDAVAVQFDAALAEGDEIEFLGWEEDTEDYAAGSATFLRNFVGCSATVARDRVAPEVTMFTAVEGSDELFVQFSEKMASGAATALDTLVSGTCTAVSSGRTEYVCTGVTVTAAAGVTLDATLLDVAGNALDSDSFTQDVLAEADYAPGIDSASVTCAKLGDGDVTQAAWVAAYAAGAAAGDFDAVPGTIVIDGTSGGDAETLTLTAGTGLSLLTANDWDFVIAHQRGLILPTLVVDGTTATITIDRFFHTAGDIARLINNSSIGRGGLGSLWTAVPSVDAALVVSALIDEELNTENSGDEQTVGCHFNITMDSAILLAARGDDPADFALTPVTASPSVEGEFRVSIGGLPVTIGENDYQLNGAVTASTGLAIEGIFNTTFSGTLRVEVFIGGDLQRLTV